MTALRTDDALAAAAMARLTAFLDAERPGWERDPALADEAREASVRYTDGHLQGLAPKEDAAAKLSYLAYFGPRAIRAVAAAVAPVLREAGPALVAVDVGAGSGAASLVLACAGAQRLHLVDRDAGALSAARRLLAGTGAPASATPEPGATLLPTDVVGTEGPRVDVHGGASWPVIGDARLVVASFVLSELVAAGATPIAAFDRIRAVAPRATRVVLVDAGDHARARMLQELRDALIARGEGVLAPCPHRDACPALVRARDWCHQRAAKHLPEQLAAFARRVGRDDVEMAFSYLVVGQPGEAPASEGVLVLGDATVEKGRVRLPVCAKQGVRFVQALKRDRFAYRALQAMPRGAVLDGRVLVDARADTAHTAKAPVVVKA